MKEISKKWIAAILAMLMVASLLAGCAGNGSSSTPESNAPATEESAQENAGEENAAEETPADELSGEVELWAWMVEQDLAYEAFNEKYPNIKMKTTAIEQGDYLTKIQTSVGAGLPLPDIIWASMEKRGTIFNLDILENLDEAPYNLNRDDLMDYCISQISDASGAVRCIPWDSGVSAYALNMNLWKEYLGVETLEEAEAMMADWDTFIETGKKLKEVDPSLYMVPSLQDAANVMLKQIDGGIVKDGSVVYSKELENVFMKVAEIRDAGLADKIEQYAAPWWSAVTMNEYLCQFMPMWKLNSIPDSFPEEKDQDGRWKLAKTPGGGFAQGG
ncbi:MAG: carbohydrate ABC transporter substrate-binding protein, partial [Lachnospiraceae bacterium]|nr:carbohydrate ABC transporter substrate-binding protein [Lachnospiraceae bacterium]